MLASFRLLLRLPALGNSRRLLAVGLAVLVGLTLVNASRPAAVRAAPLAEIPTLTLNPTCTAIPFDDIGQVTVTVHGSGFSAGQNAVLFSLGRPAQGTPNPVAVQGNGTFDTTLTLTLGGPSAPDVTAYYENATPQLGGSAVAIAFVEIPCPSPTLTLGPPDCGDPGVQLSVPALATGFQANLPVTFTVFDGSSAPPSTTVTPADGNNVTTTLVVTLPGTGVYAVQATQVPPEPTGPIILQGIATTATAYLVVPCSQLIVSPTCVNSPSAPFPVQLIGTGFQPNLSVNVVFDPTSQPQYFQPVTADANGNWTAEIDPYPRPPGTYDVIATQSNDSPIFHVTHATVPLTINDPQTPCPTGTLTPNPPCANPLLTGDQPRVVDLSIHGTGFAALSQLTLVFDPEDLAGPSFVPEQAPVAVGFDGSFDARFPNGVQARPVGSYHINALDQTGALVGQISFGMPCNPPNPRITAVKPNCGPDVNSQPPPGTYQIQILGRGFIPGAAQIVFDATGAPEPAVPAVVGDDGRLDATITPPARPPNTYHSYVEQSDALRVLYQVPFDFTVPCSTTTSPTLTISPLTVSPGFVVTVHGQGFEPGATVDLFWSAGIGANRPIEVVAGTDGSFDRQVLIFAHDFEGPRDMSAGTPANPQAFPDATAGLLVTTGPGLPPSLNVFGGSPSDQPPIILRR